MIYTLTLNPSIDYVIRFDELEKGTINRTKEEDYVFGGKGINVSSMLHHLGTKSCALGFVAGFTGQALEKGLQDQGIDTDFITIDGGFTRINVKIHAQEETELNGQGPVIEPNYVEAFYEKLASIKNGDFLVLSGNLPKQIDDNIYANIMDKLKDKQVSFVVDAFGQPLLQTLAYHPFLIKPNHHELKDLCHLEDTSDESLLQGAKQLQQLGARNVLISMAEKGAMLLDEEGIVYHMDAIKGEVVNSVGAGDSMVAGFIYGYLQTKDYQKALEYGVCCGSASAFDKGIASKEAVMRLLDQVKKI